MNAQAQHPRSREDKPQVNIEVMPVISRLADLEVYIGRSGWSSAAGRLWHHRKAPKSLQFGGPVFTCNTARAIRLETLAIKLIKHLKAADSLCVGNANIAGHGGGNVSWDEVSVIYLAWRQRRSYLPDRKPTTGLIREIADDLQSEFHDLSSRPRTMIEQGLMVARAPATEKLRVFLHDPP